MSRIFNFSANLAGIITPLVIGYAYQATGSFYGPLVYIGAVALIGAFSYSVILGDIHRLEFETAPAPAAPPPHPSSPRRASSP